MSKPTTTDPTEAPDPAAPELDDHERIVAIDLRTAQTQKLLEPIVHLLMPTDGPKEGPTQAWCMDRLIGAERLGRVEARLLS